VPILVYRYFTHIDRRWKLFMKILSNAKMSTIIRHYKKSHKCKSHSTYIRTHVIPWFSIARKRFVSFKYVRFHCRFHCDFGFLFAFHDSLGLSLMHQSALRRHQRFCISFSRSFVSSSSDARRVYSKIWQQLHQLTTEKLRSHIVIGRGTKSTVSWSASFA